MLGLRYQTHRLRPLCLVWHNHLQALAYCLNQKIQRILHCQLTAVCLLLQTRHQLGVALAGEVGDQGEATFGKHAVHHAGIATVLGALDNGLSRPAVLWHMQKGGIKDLNSYGIDFGLLGFILWSPATCACGSQTFLA